MIHHAAPSFWSSYRFLPVTVRTLADRTFALLKADLRHPSLHFKKIEDDLWSVRIGIHHRALAIDVRNGVLWFWIGSHAEYDRMIG